MGLIDGWAGVAYALAFAASELNRPELFGVARNALQLDLSNLVGAPDGSLQVNDGFRMLPYIGDGSAGIGLALSAIPRDRRRAGDGSIINRIATACRARACISADLIHGRAGLVFALSALDTASTDNVAAPSVLREQFDLLRPFLFMTNDSTAIYVAHSDNQRLSIEFSSGAAGILWATRMIPRASALLHKLDAYGEEVENDTRRE